MDKTVRETALNTVFDTREELSVDADGMFFHFKRSQDFGLAQSEPVKAAMSPNRLRVWKSPYEVEGRPL